MPSRVPATLKSMSPRLSSTPWMSVSTADLPSRMTRPIAMPATGALIGTPASISAFGQSHVTNLAPARAAQRARLTDRERWEVVVVHVTLELVRRKAVQLLLVGHRAQRRDRQRLRLSSCEKTRA